MSVTSGYRTFETLYVQSTVGLLRAGRDSRLGTAEKGAGLRRHVSLRSSFTIRLDLAAYTSVALEVSLHELFKAPLLYTLRESPSHPTPMCTAYCHRRVYL